MRTQIKLFNTLTGEKELFKPIHDPEVRMYSCGPTVYNYAHIGNLRAYVFADVLRRTLEYKGYKVKQVINITDVGHLTSDADSGDDKMVKALKREGKPMTMEGLREIADKYMGALLDDLKALNVLLPSVMPPPRASEHIQEDIELIQALEMKGFVYKTKDGLYYDVSKYLDYGKLGNINLSGQLAGARVAPNPEKKNPLDFSVWKFSSNEFGWPSPWGKGFPGWHIECSAMSRKYLGQPFDIHTGGIDHIPVHHNNEIAQSEAAFGVPLANYWIHNEHLIVPTGKMAKSGENFITLKTLKEKNIHPLSYRYFLLQTHYRSPLNFSWEALQSAQIGYHGLLAEFAKKENINAFGDTGRQREKDMLNRIRDSVNDDLNTAYPIGLLWSNIFSYQTVTASFLRELDLILGLDIENQSKKLVEKMTAVPENIKKLSAAREAARRLKDFKKSDEIREQMRKGGFEVSDTDSGTIVHKSV